MSRYRFLRQDVTEARRLFCRTLKEMSGDNNEEVVVLVTKRGDPLAVMLSAAEAKRYFAWRSEEISQDGDQGEEETEAAQREATAPRDGLEPLPEGWSTLEEYCRRCLAAGCSPETTTGAIVANYAPYGASETEAHRIVERIYGEGAEDR